MPADCSSTTESTIAAIWASDLNADTVASESDFFALGGDSLNMLTMLFRVGQAFGVEVEPETLYHHPTLGAFSRAIDNLLSTHGAPMETGSI
jgi:acyl carrier protein